MFAIEDPSQVKPMPKHAKKVFVGKITDVWQWEQELFDGSQAIFERISRPDYAYLIGVLPDKQILLVEDEQPDRGSVITPAGGKVDDGEDPRDAAMREMMEETGYEAQEVIHWHSYRPSSKAEMLTHAFIGRNIRKVSDPHLEPGEKNSLLIVTFDEFLNLGMNPRLRDWLLRIKLLEAQIDPNKKKELKHVLYGPDDKN